MPVSEQPGRPAGRPALDGLDAALLAELEADARLPVLELARRLGVARATAQSRLERLQRSGLLRLAPLIDLPRAGFPVQAFTTLEIFQGAGQELAEHLVELPHVLEAWTTTGPGDLLVHLAAASHQELQRVLDRLAALPGVARTSSVVALTRPVAYRVVPLARLAASAGTQSAPHPAMRPR